MLSILIFALLTLPLHILGASEGLGYEARQAWDSEVAHGITKIVAGPTVTYAYPDEQCMRIRTSRWAENGEQIYDYTYQCRGTPKSDTQKYYAHAALELQFQGK